MNTKVGEKGEVKCSRCWCKSFPCSPWRGPDILCSSWRTPCRWVCPEEFVIVLIQQQIYSKRMHPTEYLSGGKAWGGRSCKGILLQSDSNPEPPFPCAALGVQWAEKSGIKEWSWAQANNMIAIVSRCFIYCSAFNWQLIKFIFPKRSLFSPWRELIIGLPVFI